MSETELRKIEKLLNEYGESHQNTTNKKIHWFAVPLIYLTVVGFIWSIPNIPILEINWVWPALILTLAYYYQLSKPLMLGMAGFTLICILLVSNYNLLDAPLNLVEICISIFVIAWVFQFVGHKIEGKKPSFMRDIQFLLIGPAWLMSFIMKKYNIKY